MTSIFEGQPPKARPFPFKTRVSRVLGVYIYISYVDPMGWSSTSRFFFPCVFSITGIQWEWQTVRLVPLMDL